MKKLRDEITNAGFKINAKKTRMQIKGSCQEVTGIIVNEKINISQEYYRNIRSMCHSLFRTGAYYFPGSAVDKNGTIKTTDKLAPLEGRLAHIYYVKARRDRSEDDNKRLKYTSPIAPKKLYKNFLYYNPVSTPKRNILLADGMLRLGVETG